MIVTGSDGELAMTDESSSVPRSGRTGAVDQTRTRSSEPADEEALWRLYEAVEELDARSEGHRVDREVYRRMLGSRRNRSRARPRMLGRGEVAAHQSVVDSANFLDDLDTSTEAARSLLDVMRSRRSCRSFLPDPVPDSHRELILEAGRWSPSAGNAQPWEFLVVTEPAAKEALAEALALAVGTMRVLDDTFPGYANPRYVTTAPLLVLPYADMRCMAAYPYPLPREPRRHMLEQSMAMCIQNMWLMATRLGLGATNWTLGHPVVDSRIREQFGVPEHFVMSTLLVLGYPRHVPMPRPRRALEEMTHLECFDADRVRSDEELVEFFYEYGVRGRGFR